MAITVNLHVPKQVVAAESGGTSWLQMSDKDGNDVTVFMPFATALAMAGAFNRASAGAAEPATAEADA